MKRLVVCISGTGSNLQAILDAIDARQIAAEVVLVVSNRKAAYGLLRAENAGVPTRYVPLKPYAERGRAAYDADLAALVLEYQPDFVVLAGWMHIFSPAFLRHFPNQVINLHPALPGMFPGLHAIERAFAAYTRGEIDRSGCMIHYVISEVDAGDLIEQAIVRFEPGDTVESFEERIHAAEHQLIVAALAQLCGTQ
jgi:formyltetrahydrofolate-dependent phosphoribosylglycinamide formyltransferase